MSGASTPLRSGLLGVGWLSGDQMIKRSLTDLYAAAKESLARESRYFERETRYLRPAGAALDIPDEDELLASKLEELRRLENLVAGLQIDSLMLDGSRRVTPSRLVPLGAFNEHSFWAALERRYAGLLRGLVADALDDSLRVVACEAWEMDLCACEAEIERFERVLDGAAGLGGLAKSGADSAQPRAGVARNAVPTPRQFHSDQTSLTVNDRLLLNLLRRSPHQRPAAAVTEIERISCANLPAPLQAACLEIWEVIVTLCGLRPKRYRNRADAQNADRGSVAESLRGAAEVYPDSTRGTAESATRDLKSLVLNSLRCLEDMCQQQIWLQLYGRRDRSTAAPPGSTSQSRMRATQLEGETAGCAAGGTPIVMAPPDQLLERLCDFCATVPVVIHGFPNQLAHYWQLTYWGFRCGSPAALNLLRQQLCDGVNSRRNDNQSDSGILLLCVTIDLLIEALRHRSRSTSAILDCIWDAGLTGSNSQLTYTERGTEEVADPNSQAALLELLDESLADDFSTYRQLNAIHPVASLLFSLIRAPQNGTVPSNILHNALPDATAEDYLWYRFHVILLSATEDTLPVEIAKLQAQVVAAGPGYFGSLGASDSSEPPNFAFGKVSSLCLAPNVAIEWISTVYPELSLICLQWLVYLAQLGVWGSPDSLMSRFFSKANTCLGSSILVGSFEALLVGKWHCCAVLSSLETALQYCELLPFAARTQVASTLLTMSSDLLLHDDTAEGRVIGVVADDGSCRGGLLLRVLQAPDWSAASHADLDLSSDYDGVSGTRQLTEAKHMFESLVTSLAEVAASKDLLVPAMRLRYLVSQDHSAIELLLRIFSNPEIFPRFDRPSNLGAALQREALKFYSIFEHKFKSGEAVLDAAVPWPPWQDNHFGGPGRK